MELDEMKQLWQQQDKLLQQNKILNEQLIQKLLREKSKTAVSRMLNFEYLGLFVSALLIFIYLLHYNTIFENTLMTASYFFSLLSLIGSVTLFFFKHQLLTKIEDSNNTITDTVRSLERFRLLISKERLWSFILSPFLIFTTLVVFVRWVLNRDMMNYMGNYLPSIIIGSVALMIGIGIIYSRLYMGNIKKIKENLEEIENLKSELQGQSPL